MTKMHKLSHPGALLREDVLPALGLTVTAAAIQLGVTRTALSRVLNARVSISAEMALRLEKWLGADNGGSADVWVAQQAAYDLSQARRNAADALKCVKRIRIKSAVATSTRRAAA